MSGDEAIGATSDGNWGGDRLEPTYGEARTVLQAQNDTMADIDDKAMQTVRFNTVLIGLLLTAANAASPSIFHPPLFGAGIVTLVGSIFLGLVTYIESDLFVGPRGAYVVALTHGETIDSWDVDLLESLAGMVPQNSGELVRNSWLLTGAQVMFMVGIVTSILSVVI